MTRVTIQSGRTLTRNMLVVTLLFTELITEVFGRACSADHSTAFATGLFPDPTLRTNGEPSILVGLGNPMRRKKVSDNSDRG